MSHKSIALVVSAVLALAIPLSAASAASALPAAGTNVLVFSNVAITDPGQEDADIAAALVADGNTVTTFDGGDASATAWTAALAGIDVLVFPEATGDIYAPGGTPWVSDAAALVIKSWIESGHTVLSTGSYTHLELINYFTGLDYSGVWNTDTPAEGEWELQVSSSTMPATLPEGNYTGGQAQFSTWSPALKAPLTVFYLSADGTNMGVGSFAVGAGEFLYYAYDWFPDSAEIADGTRAAWNGALAMGASGEIVPDAPAVPAAVAPAALDPVLAATGFDLTLYTAVGGALLALGILSMAGAAASKSRRGSAL